jgi:hypothetical protein
MRQPANTPLQTLVAALPDEALRPLVLALLQNGASAPAAEPATPPRRAARPRLVAKPRRGGWPKGKPRRGRPPKVETAAALEAKLAARRERNNAAARAKRSAAKVEHASTSAQQTADQASNGNGVTQPKPTAAMLWAHAATLSPKAPWKAVARELGTNEQQAVDCYRLRKFPPGVAADALALFLELSPS